MSESIDRFKGITDENLIDALKTIREAYSDGSLSTERRWFEFTHTEGKNMVPDLANGNCFYFEEMEVELNRRNLTT